MATHRPRPTSIETAARIAPLPSPGEPKRRAPWWATTLLAPTIVAAIKYGPDWWRLFFGG